MTQNTLPATDAIYESINLVQEACKATEDGYLKEYLLFVNKQLQGHLNSMAIYLDKHRGERVLFEDETP